jgi:hypothetical protein
MKHLYDDGEGEIYAADSVEQAERHVRELVGEKDYDPAEYGWVQVDDDKPLSIRDENDVPVTKTAREWAAECDKPVQVSTQYN